MEKTLAKSHEIDLTSGNLFKKIVLFTLPIMATTILQLLYSQVDLVTLRIFGGGDASVAAVGINGSLINLIVGLFLGLSTGANVVMAQAKGRKDAAFAQKVLQSSLLLALVFGFIVGTFGAIFSRYFLLLMNVTEDVIDNATIYLTIYFLGMPSVMVYNYGAAMQRALGDSRRPLYTLLISAALNVLLNLLFVIVFKLDVMGVAITTVISEFVSAAITVYWLYNNHDNFVKLNFKEFKFDKEASLEVIRIGLPAGLQSIIFSISNVFIQAEANAFGTASEVGNTAASNVEGYLYNILFSVAQTATAAAAQNYGASKKENLAKILRICLIIEVVLGIVLGAIMYALADYELKIFITNSPEAMKIGKDRLLIILLTYFTCGTMDTLSGLYRGEKFTNFPMIATLIGCCILRLVFIFTLFKMEYFHTLVWLYSLYPISWVVTTGIYLCAYPFIKKRVYANIDKDIALKAAKEAASIEAANA